MVPNLLVFVSGTAILTAFLMLAPRLVTGFVFLGESSLFWFYPWVSPKIRNSHPEGLSPFLLLPSKKARWLPCHGRGTRGVLLLTRSLSEQNSAPTDKEHRAITAPILICFAGKISAVVLFIKRFCPLDQSVWVPRLGSLVSARLPGDSLWAVLQSLALGGAGGGGALRQAGQGMAQSPSGG